MRDCTAQSKKRLAAVHCLCAVGVLWLASGCNRNPYANPYAAGAYPATPFGAPPAGTWQPPTAAGAPGFTQPQLAELERRVQQLDVNNRQLTTQLAQSQQQMQVFRDRADLLQKQLSDTAAQLQASRLAQQELQGQARGLQASMNQRGGATLRPNTSQPNTMQPNSMQPNALQPGGVQPGTMQPYQPLPSTQISNRPTLPTAAGIQVPGAFVEQDGELIRVRIPSDQLFAPGTAQIGPSAHQVLDALAASIARSYPRQRITVEAHTDSGNLYGGAFSNQVQLGHAQSQAVIDQLVRRNQLPAQQMSAVSHGPNYPRADNATAAGRAENRRIECVIYPAGF